MTHEDDEISLLNGLTQITMDSIEGYRESADKAANYELKSQLADRAIERREVVAMLRNQVEILGGRPEETGTLAGDAHRIFVNLRTAMTNRDDDALLAEIRRGENHLISRFDEALLDENASPDTREVIEQGHRRISAGYGKMLAQVSQQTS